MTTIRSLPSEMRQLMAQQARLPSPKSRRALMRVMNKNADESISWAEIDETGFFVGDLRDFRARYFPGRKKVKLGELVPFVRYAHSYWADVLGTVCKILRLRQLAARDYFSYGKISAPSNRLPSQYLVGRGALPTTLKGFIKIAAEHGRERITWADAVRTGACEEGLEEFQLLHFPGRRQLTIGELVPFLQFRHDFWEDVMLVVMSVMARRGILVAGYSESYHRPQWSLPAKYYAA